MYLEIINSLYIYKHLLQRLHEYISTGNVQILQNFMCTCIYLVQTNDSNKVKKCNCR